MPVLTNLQVCCLVAEADVNQAKLDLAKFLPEDRYSITVVADLEVLVSLLKNPQFTGLSSYI